MRSVNGGEAAARAAVSNRAGSRSAATIRASARAIAGGVSALGTESGGTVGATEQQSFSTLRTEASSVQQAWRATAGIRHVERQRATQENAVAIARANAVARFMS